MKVKVQQDREEINSIGGISLIGGLFNSLNFKKKVDSMRMNKVKTGKIKHSGILKTIAGLFGLGKNDYADVTPFRDDAFFCDCLQLSAVPSEETLRQRIDEFARAQEIPRVIKFSNVEMLKKVPDFGSEKTAHAEYIPLDIDVCLSLRSGSACAKSPLDNSGSNKEGVSWTYKIMMVTYQYLLISELMAICSTTNYAQPCFSKRACGSEYKLCLFHEIWYNIKLFLIFPCSISF